MDFTMDNLNPEIIVGTNEEFILSYKLKPREKANKYDFIQSFANHSHMGSVRQVAVSGKYLVSGGTDELIRIFNLDRRCEIGELMEHEGTVRCLQFYQSSYLFSASEDHKICVIRTRNWKCEKTLKGHNASVTSLAVHPSGKLALSSCKDKKLITWNLIKGRKAYTTNIKTVADIVYWSPDGSKYLVVCDSKVDIYEVSTATISHTADFHERVNAILFIKDDIMIVGGEGHNLCLYDINKQQEILQWTAHDNRVKCLCHLKSEETETIQILSASSDGFIKLWRLQIDKLNKTPEMIGEVNTSCRIICMTVYYPSKQHTTSKSENSIEVEDSEKKEEEEADSSDTNSEEEENVEVVKYRKVTKVVPGAKKRTKKRQRLC